jgi:nuclease A inhibitor-like protein
MSAGRQPEVRLAHALSALTAGLLYPGSESDSPYEPLHAAMDASVPLTARALRSALRLAPWWQIDVSDGEQWLSDTIAWARDPNGGDDEAAAQAYELLQRTMHATLDGPLQRASVAAPPDGPFHKTRRLIFGRLAGAPLVGLVAYSVET